MRSSCSGSRPGTPAGCGGGGGPDGGGRGHQWGGLLPLVGAFVFVASHGVAVWMSVQLSRERDPRRIAALLDLSSISLGGVYGGLALLLIGGIWAGIDGGFFSRGWIWAAIAVLVVIIVAM